MWAVSRRFPRARAGAYMLLSLIEQHWSLHKAGIEADLKGYDGRIVYRIKADEGDFVVKIGKPFYSEREIEQELFIFDFLQSKEFTSAPILLKGRDGSSFRRLHEGFAYIYHFIEGEKPSPSANNYQKLGELTAHLHQLECYPYSAKWSADDVIGHIIADRAPHLPASMKREYLQIAESLCAMGNLPVCLVHGDISLSNSLQTPSGKLVLIDWDGCATSPRIFDVGYPLLQFLSQDLIFDDDAATSFYGTYFQVQKISNKEFDCVVDAALLFALNFILFGRIDENWAKIKWAWSRREELTEKIDNLRN